MVVAKSDGFFLCFKSAELTIRCQKEKIPNKHMYFTDCSLYTIERFYTKVIRIISEITFLIKSKITMRNCLLFGK